MEINSDKDVESKLIHEFQCRMTTIIPYFYWPMSSTTVTSLHSLISLRFICLTNE